MKVLKQLKESYDNIETPKDYDSFIAKAIEKSTPKKRFFFYFKIAFAASFCLYVLCLNTIPTFAKTMFDIPIINKISKVFCFVEFDEVSKTKEIHIEIPHIKNTGNSELERRVNAQIQLKIDSIVKEVRKEAKALEKEYKKVYAESESFIPANVFINYEVYFQDENTLSFVIKKVVANASSLSENYVYNYDLKTGNKITLQSLLGNNYKSIVDKQINKQIQQTMQQNSNALFFDGDIGFQGIQQSQNFYINEEGHIVILFNKYEIAPGYMGDIEFILNEKIHSIK